MAGTIIRFHKCRANIVVSAVAGQTIERPADDERTLRYRAGLGKRMPTVCLAPAVDRPTLCPLRSMGLPPFAPAIGRG